MAEEKNDNTTYHLEEPLTDLGKILDFSMDLICSCDEEGRFVWVNKASERILGYKPEELIGKKYSDFLFHEDNGIPINENFDFKSETHLPIFEKKFIHKNTNIIYLQWSIVRDNVKNLCYCIGRDITEKKNIEKAIEFERLQFFNIYSQAPSYMGILNGPNHVYELANELYLQLIDKRDIIGKTVKEVLPELETQGIFEILDNVFKTGESFCANEMLITFDRYSDGKFKDFYLNFIFQARRNADNTIDGIFIFGNDVTEQVLSRKKN
ncbi:PAS domain-containing protein [Flavobacterium sp. CGRL2]